MLITGAAGFIGMNLMKLCDAHPFDLKYGQSCLNMEQLREVYTGGPIIHLAAESGVPQSIENPEPSYVNNTVATYAVARFACEVDAPLIFASSQAADYMTSPYAASKRSGEAYIEAFGECYNLQYQICRLSNVYGPHSDHKTSVVAKMIRDAKKGKIEIYGDGSQLRDFIYVKDVARDLLYWADNPCNTVVRVCTGITTSVKDLAEIIANHIPCDVEVKDGPVGVMGLPKDESDGSYLTLEQGLDETLKYYGV